MIQPTENDNCVSNFPSLQVCLTVLGLTFPWLWLGHPFPALSQSKHSPLADDSVGQVLGCQGSPIADYHGFTVGLYYQEMQGAIPLKQISSALANPENHNPFPLNQSTDGKFNFVLDLEQITPETTYVLIVNPPERSRFGERRIQVRFGSPQNNQIPFTAKTLDGLPISTQGNQETSGRLPIAANSIPLNFKVMVCDRESLKITKSSDRASASPGEVAVFRLQVQNIATGDLENLTVTDTLPVGFQLVEGSIEAHPPCSPHVMEGCKGGAIAVNPTQEGQTLTFTFDQPLPKNGKLRIAYAARITPDALRGEGESIARVSGVDSRNGMAVADSSEIHKIRVRGGLLSDAGTIVGRVFVDENGDGEAQAGEKGIPNAVIFLDNGTQVTTDEDGLFSLTNVLPGARVGIIDLDRLQGYTLAENQAFRERNSPSRLVNLSPGGIARMNFPMQETASESEVDPESPPEIAMGVVNFRLGGGGIDFSDIPLTSPLRGSPDEETSALSAEGAVFATGEIGEWRFTGALNSDRALNEDGSGVRGLTPKTQADDQVYPVYGDESVTSSSVSSQDSVFLRLEQPSANGDPNYLMWGTYGTSEFTTSAQQFSATSRNLHGFKTNYTFENLQLTAFYSENLQGFQRDAIAPNGTSQLYFLSKRLLIPGSEEVYLETEPLNRPGTVVSRTKLNRGRNYTIDYDRGTLLFKQPIWRTKIAANGSVLVQRIIVNYQFDSNQDDTYIGGGRARYHFSRKANQKSWLGASYVEEEQGRRDFSLFGVDSQISLGEAAKLTAEYARSSMEAEDANQVNADAYRVQVQGKLTPDILAQALWRTTDAGFTNQSTVSFVPGQTRYGASLQAKVGENTTLRAKYDHEDNFGVAPVIPDTLEQLLANPSQPGEPVDNRLSTITTGVLQKLGESELTVDWVHRDREDEITNLNSTSSQLRSRLSVPLSEEITAYALNETTLSSETDAVVSDRSAIGLGWEIAPGIELGASQQWFTRGQFAGRAITRLDLGGNHAIGEDTTLTGHYSIAEGTDGMNTEAALGLKHRWEMLPGMKVALGYERVFGGDFFGNNATGKQFPQPFAVGQTASSLGFSDGATYHLGVELTPNPDWEAKAKIEHHSDDNGNRTVINTRLSGELSEEITAIARYRQAGASNQTLEDLADTINLRLGFAYRDPDNDQWNALFKYEYRQNPSTLPSNLLAGNSSGSTDHVFSAEAVYAPSWQWEFYGKYAFRDSLTFLASDLVTESHLSLVQLRGTHRFAESWDFTGEARWIEQHTADFSETGVSVELGYYATPGLRLSVGYSWGEVLDRDFGRDGEGVYFDVTYKVNNLLNGFRTKEKPHQPL